MDVDRVFDVLDEMVRRRGKPEVLIHGGATGVDMFADWWGLRRDIEIIRFPIPKQAWKEFGRRAGYMRNERMLKEGKPTLVMVFPGGAGTRMMSRMAQEMGYETIRSTF